MQKHPEIVNQLVDLIGITSIMEVSPSSATICKICVYSFKRINLTGIITNEFIPGIDQTDRC